MALDRRREIVGMPGGREVRLVGGQDRRRVGRDQFAVDRLKRHGPIEDRDDRSACSLFAPRPFDPDALDRVKRLAQTGGIRQLDGPAPERPP